MPPSVIDGTSHDISSSLPGNNLSERSANSAFITSGSTNQRPR